MDLVSDDDGHVQLPKVQMLFWTIIAVVIYFIETWRTVSRASAGGSIKLPDIDTTLLVLTGLGQGTYLGRKLLDSDQPVLHSATPAAVRAGDTVILRGAGIDNPAAIQIKLDAIPLDAQVTELPQPEVGAVQFTAPQSLNADPWIRKTTV
jgi:hypothetical protein